MPYQVLQLPLRSCHRLCTAGFGLATLRWSYFLGAFYLFFINAVFISAATYLIVKSLHFPEKGFINRRLERQYRFWFGLVGFFVLIPSVYFLYTVYRRELVKKDIETLVINPIKREGNEILKWDLVSTDSTYLIKVYHSGSQLSDSMQHAIDSALHTHRMPQYYIMPMRINLTKDEVSQLSAEMTRQMFQEMHIDELREQNLQTQQAAKKAAYAQVFNEVRIAFPQIDTLYNGWLSLADSAKNIDTLPIVFYKPRRNITRTQQQQLYDFLKVRLSRDTIVVIRQ